MMKTTSVLTYNVGPLIGRVLGGAFAGAVCFFACVDILYAFGVYSHYAISQFTAGGAVVGSLLALIRPPMAVRTFLILACYGPSAIFTIATAVLNAYQGRTFEGAYQAIAFLTSGFLLCLVASALTAVAILSPEYVRISFGREAPNGG